jgi:hypothetical protein
VFHLLQLVPESAGSVLTPASLVDPMRAGATKSRGGNERIANSGHCDRDLHEATPSNRGEKQNGPVQ